MIYADQSALITEILKFYEDTDTSLYPNTYRTEIAAHNASRALQDIWQRWGQSFTVGYSTVVMTAGKGALPSNFAAVEEGYFQDSNGNPYTPIDHIDMLQLRAKGLYSSQRLYSIGDFDPAVSQGGQPPTYVTAWYVYVPSTTSTDTFSVGYKKVAPSITSGSTLPVPLPEVLHGALLAGAAYYTKLGLNDKRAEQYRLDFERECGRAKAVSRKPTAYQLPNTIGGQW